jgi:hypothetical protein
MAERIATIVGRVIFGAIVFAVAILTLLWTITLIWRQWTALFGGASC